MNPLVAPSSVAQALAQPQQTPFVWGQGGSRLTPEQLAMERERAASMMQSDYSPVGHWSQGLGRVADNVLGAFEMKGVKKDEAEMQASRDAQIAQLLGAGNADLAPAFTSNDPVAQSLAETIFGLRNPKPSKPLEFQQILIDAGFKPGTPEYQAEALRLARAKNDPFITASLPDGGFYGGPQSGFMTALTGGGGQAVSPAAGTASPSPANIPNGSPTNPNMQRIIPNRPQGMSDVDLLKQAEEVVRAGADPYEVMDQLKAWGVRR